VTILRVDDLPDYGTVVFVTIDGLRIVDATASGGVQTRISFSAFTLDAIERSVVRLDGQLEAPDCSEQYRHWRKAHDEGLAAPSMKTVYEAVRTVQAICDRRNG
jgi:hypothetical protein